ncbi:MAG: sulfurtransferase [Deltaproteobacteria bacterium]|nr:sulfurtransferase [Deltaproteobacteria bacterium]
MTHRTLIDVATLHEHFERDDWRVLDCRFVLADPDEGRRTHAAATIPGAAHVDLDADLSGPIVPGTTGRHPLPTREAFVATLGRLGIDGGTQVVAFDDRGGIFAARLWWMMRWVGHEAVAVLDGGLPAWVAAGHALAPGQGATTTTTFVPSPSTVGVVSAAHVHDGLADASVVLLDARSAPRFRGENESTDPVAGHIPGARSAPCMDNLGAEARFKSASELATRFGDLLGAADPTRAIAYCGSGVTACHDLLAMAHAGMPLPRLFPGSWSEWITDRSRPVATGDG